MYSIYRERRNTRSIGLRGSTDDRMSQKKKTQKNTKNSNFAKTKITTTAIIVLVEFVFDQHNEPQRSITKHSRTKRNASIRRQFA
jgi:hypothetical protein